MKKAFFKILISFSFSCSAFAVTLTPEQQLGEMLYKDKNLSLNRNQSCDTCHSLTPAYKNKTQQGLAPSFVDVTNVKKGTAVSTGSIESETGNLNAPTIAYASFSPEFHFDETEELYIGGQFWNGRAKNLIEQAGKPLLNPVEMAMPDELSVVQRLQENPHYIDKFKQLYKVDLTDTSEKSVEKIYHRLTQAISAFEQSAIFNKFNSKFDYALFGKTQLSTLEKKGLALFQGKAKCSACHTIDIAVDEHGNMISPVFTDFSYDNIGSPRNVNIPKNPEPSLGLGGRTDISKPEAEIGKHKVMTLRNIALTAPYGHNGVFKTLEQIVHFYNTRDTLKKVADNSSPEFGKTAWAEPEIAENVNTDELGNLELTTSEEKAIVAFLKTLTDDYSLWGKDTKVPVGTPSPFDFGASFLMK
jgi:cytochrome c peroxidase